MSTIRSVANIKGDDDIRHVLSPIPYSLAHNDGTLRKATKSKLLQALVEKVTTCSSLPPVHNATYIFDGMALIQAIKNGEAKTFGEMANK